MARGFVAVVPPRRVLDAVREVSDTAQHRATDFALPALRGARFTRRAQWHLTLQFLGNRTDLDAVTGALEAVSTVPFAVALGGLGGFPSTRGAGVLWVGVTEGRDRLGALAAAVGDAVAPFGHTAEFTPYRPHLTLARLARRADLRPAVEEFGDRAVGAAWKVTRMVLFESVTHPSGAQYRAHARIPLR